MALTEKQIQELQGAIEQRRTSLVAELRDDVERVRRDRFEDLAGAAPDPGDESVATLIADLGHADMERDLSELRALEAARARLADGSYGVCAECGGDIGVERLRANPAAVRCVHCQRVHEKTFAGPSTSSL
ncbi:MAG TPA: TraR/DksA C4-type zinc finger protein [Burkholderiales bacterium]|jgi:RNA polymerase-binding transcription factor DksA|nr:TraR/DksA C4-type zinc finger protein [Burkholderiales bacterium]HSA70969.1 TraR/DksA C4-type zinc finger protein [Burkholderiales bacterium]